MNLLGKQFHVKNNNNRNILLPEGSSYWTHIYEQYMNYAAGIDLIWNLNHCCSNHSCYL